jgi:acetyl-CoA acyltransferase
MRDVVIAAAYRSACGRALKGSLALTRPDELLGQVIRGLLDRCPQVRPELIQDALIGCAMPEGEQGLNIARPAALLGGLPIECAAITLNRFCSSGLQAIASAAHEVAFGDVDIAIAGGVESMSMVPMGGNKMSSSPEAMDKIGSVYTPMGITAENVAAKFNISRADQDAFALASHQKAIAAIDAGRFRDEIIAVRATRYGVQNGKRVRDDFVFDRDELARADTNLEGLSKLRPAFSAKGTVTAGNSSPLTDGAAAVLVMSSETAKSLGIEPLAIFRGFLAVGVAPEIMGIGPVPAVQKLLSRKGLSVADIDLFEMNEAFAAQALYSKRSLEIPDDKLNVNGGAIALGHPLGATGAKLTATLVHEMKRRNAKRGIVTMCIGGGQGAAALFEAP